ncbi:Carbon-nitrogen hydrolase [Allomyces javanicus]|nr:Carbon-nitrogen hydrolase [Allomyces javanicus]
MSALGRTIATATKTVSNETAPKALAAVVQMCSTADVGANLHRALKVVQAAASRGAKTILFPEATDYVAENAAQARALAQPLMGPFVTALRETAATHQVEIVVGVHEKLGDDEVAQFAAKQSDHDPPTFANALVAIDGAQQDAGLGRILAVYRKMHLFDVDIPNGPRLHESATCAAGDRVVDPVPLHIGQLGLAICYDIRFPALSAALRARGANVLTFPSAFTEPTGAAHWSILNRARAIETQCYVVSPAQIGRHSSARSSYGAAMVVDPWGRVLVEGPPFAEWPRFLEQREAGVPVPMGEMEVVEADPEGGAAFALFEVNHAVTDKTRQSMPVWTHRREPVLYQ